MFNGGLQSQTLNMEYTENGTDRVSFVSYS